MSADPARRLRQMLGIGKRELLTIEQLTREYPDLFRTTEACRKWVRRHLPFTHVGRRVVIDRADFHRYLDDHRQLKASA